MAVILDQEQNSTKIQLAHMWKLQELDNEIMDFEEEREKIPSKFGSQESLLLEKRSILEDIENQIHMLKDEEAEIVRSLDLEQLKLKNARNKETAIENIKQYEAFVREVEVKEKSSEDIESELAALRARLTELKGEYKDLNKEINSAKQVQKTERSGLETRLKELDSTLDELYDSRDELAERIREDLYYKYEYIAEGKNGIAMAIVEDGTCILCNMAIPPQMYNELIRGDQIMTCPACNRILIYKENKYIQEIFFLYYDVFLDKRRDYKL